MKDLNKSQQNIVSSIAQELLAFTESDEDGEFSRSYHPTPPEQQDETAHNIPTPAADTLAVPASLASAPSRRESLNPRIESALKPDKQIIGLEQIQVEDASNFIIVMGPDGFVTRRPKTSITTSSTPKIQISRNSIFHRQSVVDNDPPDLPLKSDADAVEEEDLITWSSNLDEEKLNSL